MMTDTERRKPRFNVEQELSRYGEKFLKNSEGVHLMHGEYTICGYAWDAPFTERGDDIYGDVFKKTRNKTVTCRGCISVIRLCKSVRTKPE